MEAKDTVRKRLVGLTDRQNEILGKLLERQDKISFKAGEKKVVEWIQNHGGCLDGYRTEWQEFLKSEGPE